jgi:beta-mannosidase
MQQFKSNQIKQANIKPANQLLELSRQPIIADWLLFRSAANQYTNPAQFDYRQQQCYPSKIPSTIATSINQTEAECWSNQIDYHDYDWWYCAEFDAPESSNNVALNFDGLATFCEVWLNGELVLTTDNMFRGYSIAADNLKQSGNQLFLVFRSVNSFLEQKRPRPRWKTRLVEHQQMRYVRATVLGHVSVWTPPIKVVGPWRDIYFSDANSIQFEQFKLRPFVDKQTPCLSLAAEIVLNQTTSKTIEEIDQVSIEINEKSYPVEIKKIANRYQLSCDLRLTEIHLWWPHTHGKPHLYQCHLIINVQDHQLKIDCGKLGFKKAQYTANDDTTEISINDQTIFCRGSCWTVSDYLSLNASRKTLKHQLEMLRDAGINMLRVGGTMVYESDDFYQLCDQLGIMVWQDFMFASMDYPVDDDGFAENIKTEITQQLNRLQQYTCITLYCGNTDVEAQAAMFGMPKEIWSNELFAKWLPSFCNEIHSDIPYIESSPTGGAMPFHLNHGVSHFWANGAYMLPTTDNNKAQVKFASEGMGLSHIPEDKTITDSIGKTTLFPFDNTWTTRIPRDLGAGWDFDAIRDFYLAELFDVDPVLLKRSHVERYIALSRIVTGEVLSRLYRYWRSGISQCNGALIWFNRDFWPCAGFGLVDSNNRAKAALYQLKNIWSNRQIIIQSHGLDGANITVINEQPNQLKALVKVELIKHGNTLVTEAEHEINIAPNSHSQFSLDEMLGRFYDTGYAYKFGEAQFDVICCRLVEYTKAYFQDECEQKTLSEDFLYANKLGLNVINQAEISTEIQALDDDEYLLTIESDYFLQFVNISSKNHIAEQNYFHLAPNHRKTILLKPEASIRSSLLIAKQPLNKETKLKFRGEVNAINMAHGVKFKA